MLITNGFLVFMGIRINSTRNWILAPNYSPYTLDKY